PDRRGAVPEPLGHHGRTLGRHDGADPLEGELVCCPPMSQTLSEHESKELLRGAGIPVPEDRLVESADAAVRAAQALGFPVALKLCGRKIAHKTERGL